MKQECPRCGSENIEKLHCGDWWCNRCDESFECPIETEYEIKKILKQIKNDRNRT